MEFLFEITKKTFTGKPVQGAENGSVYISPGAFSMRLDDTGAYKYIGEALPGSSEDEGVWRIQRITIEDKSVVWADGDGVFDNVWANHLALNYS